MPIYRFGLDGLAPVHATVQVEADDPATARRLVPQVVAEQGADWRIDGDPVKHRANDYVELDEQGNELPKVYL